MILLLFDIDGTLLLSGGAGTRAMSRAGKRVFGDRFSLSDVAVAGRLDPLIYLDAALTAGVGDPSRHHTRFRQVYLEILAAELAAHPDSIRALPGVPELLDRVVAREDLTVGLLTGNYARAAPLKLRAAGIDPALFSVTACGDEAPDRRSLVAVAIDRVRARTGAAAAPDFIVIGDTPLDVDCAHANGGRCLAVATGLFTVRQLQDAGADVTVPSLQTPGPLFELIAAVR